MKVADIYGTVQTAQPTSNGDLNPQAMSAGQEKQANAQATGTKFNYGVFTLVAMFGILLGIKYGLEKRGK